MGRVVNEQLLWMWKEVAVAYFGIIRTNAWRLTKTTKNLRIVYAPRFEPGTTETRYYFRPFGSFK
jgi:hypothetical protein